MNIHPYRIVVGVDGSDGGRRALRWAVHHAATRGGSVQAVMAWHPGEFDAPPHGATNPRQEQWPAREILDREVDRTDRPNNVMVVAEVVEGRAADVLTMTARHADLLVLGSHGHGRLHHALGSVSDDCVRQATCPVVIVPPRPATATRTSIRGYR